jgi:hypothetical protein
MICVDRSGPLKAGISCCKRILINNGAMLKSYAHRPVEEKRSIS